MTGVESRKMELSRGEDHEEDGRDGRGGVKHCCDSLVSSSLRNEQCGDSPGHGNFCFVE